MHPREVPYSHRLLRLSLHHRSIPHIHIHISQHMHILDMIQELHIPHVILTRLEVTKYSDVRNCFYPQVEFMLEEEVG
jgi:hypothetical protein